MAHRFVTTVSVVQSFCSKRSLLWSLRNPRFLTQTFCVVRDFHRSRPNNFEVSLSRLDKSDSKDFTNEDWRKHLSPQQYHICREKGTEPPWSGEFLDKNDSGIYCCLCCGADLFNSSTKYDSQSGWPSFWAAIEHEQTKEQRELGIPNLSVDQHLDHSHSMVRVEVLCKQCGSHLGHVFRDGPKPTGLRYCINSIALEFKPDVL